MKKLILSIAIFGSLLLSANFAFAQQTGPVYLVYLIKVPVKVLNLTNPQNKGNAAITVKETALTDTMYPGTPITVENSKQKTQIEPWIDCQKAHIGPAKLPACRLLFNVTNQSGQDFKTTSCHGSLAQGKLVKSIAIQVIGDPDYTGEVVVNAYPLECYPV